MHRLRSRDAFPGARHGIGCVFLCLLVACSGCPSSDGNQDAAGEACDYASCEAYCRSLGLCYGSCAGGICRCGCGADADADIVREDGGPDRVDASDVEPAEDAAVRPDAGDCTYRAPDETRPGASPGVTCRRLSVPELEYAVLYFSADGDNVIVPLGVRGIDALWHLRRSAGCWQELVETRSDLAAREVILDVALQARWVAYSSGRDASPAMRTCELCLFDLETRELRVLDSNTSEEPGNGASPCDMRPIALEYPWVVWRDIRQVGAMYPWDVLAVDLRSGAITNLSIDPATGEREWGSSTVRVDIRNGLAVFDADWYNPTPPPNVFMDIVSVDLWSWRRRQITAVAGEQYNATVTEDWVAWIDLRWDPMRTSFAPCSADIYGWNRATGEEVLLVGGEDTAMHGPALDAEGPWLAYADHRWGPWPACSRADEEQDIVALHVPTRTEVRITDWPGREGGPCVYHRGDGSYGLLINQEIDYATHTYRLWDCDLPEP